jgi:hypothetical protein
MTARDLFGVVVRTIGLYYAVSGVSQALGGLSTDNEVASEYLLWSLATMGLGIVVFAAANPIVEFSYRTREPYDGEDQDRGPGVWTGPEPEEQKAPDSN